MSSRLAARVSSSAVSLQLSQDRVVRQLPKGGLHARLAPFIAELVEVLDCLKKLPHGINGRCDGVVVVWERNDAHHLRKVGITGGANEQPARLATWFFGVGSEPWPCPIAMAQGVVLDDDSQGHTAFLAALAAHRHIGEIAAGALIVEP